MQSKSIFKVGDRVKVQNHLGRCDLGTILADCTDSRYHGGNPFVSPAAVFPSNWLDSRGIEREGY